jgi:hypothetical protein
VTPVTVVTNEKSYPLWGLKRMCGLIITVRAGRHLLPLMRGASFYTFLYLLEVLSMSKDCICEHTNATKPTRMASLPWVASNDSYTVVTGLRSPGFCDLA